MHPKLNGIEFWEDLKKSPERGLCVSRQVIGCHAPDQAGHSLTCFGRCTRYAAALHTAPIDVIPDSCGNLDPTFVGDDDHFLEGCRVFRLSFGCQPYELY